MLKIKDLHVQTSSRKILNGINLQVFAGEVHAIMGPNGSGKSTLAKVIAGHSEYQVTKGQIQLETDFKYQDITNWPPEQRTKEGLFMAFQYPVEVHGVSNLQLLRASFNAICQHHKAPEMNEKDFLSLVDKTLKRVGLPASFLHRSVNEDFSGGEKKRNEILQMTLLSPRIAILDETDSGLDIDSLVLIAQCLKEFLNKNKALILITHYDRLLHHIKPHFVHIIQEGKIQKTGNHSLAEELEKKGYSKLI